MVIETEAFELYDKKLTNDTKIEQVYYDCFGTPVYLHPGEAKTVRMRRRVPSAKLKDALEKEAQTDGTSTSHDKGQRPPDSGKPKEDRARATLRRFHRKRA